MERPKQDTLNWHRTPDTTKRRNWRVGMYQDLMVCVLQIDGNHPVVPTYRTEDQLVGLHLEPSLDEETVQVRKASTSQRSSRQQRDCCSILETEGLVQQPPSPGGKEFPLDGKRGIPGHGDWSRREWRR